MVDSYRYPESQTAEFPASCVCESLHDAKSTHPSPSLSSRCGFIVDSCLDGMPIPSCPTMLKPRA